MVKIEAVKHVPEFRYKDIHWNERCRTRPDLSRGRVKLIGEVCDVGDSASNQIRFEVPQPLHRCSVSY